MGEEFDTTKPLNVIAALKNASNNYITLTITDPGYPVSSINVYKLDGSLIRDIPVTGSLIADGKLYVVHNNNFEPSLIDSAPYQFSAVNSATGAESGKSGDVTLRIDTEIHPTIGTPVNDGKNIKITVTDNASVNAYYIMDLTNDQITFPIEPITNSKTISFPVPTDLVTTSIFLLAQSTAGNSYIMSSPVKIAIPLKENPVPCFLASAPVLTPSGYRRIDSLAEGDKIMTGDGRAVAIERVHRSRVAASAKTNPYIIPKGQHGAIRRLQISPNHRVQTATGMIEARHLGLEQEKCKGILDYYNLELPTASDTMVIAGVTVESMAPARRFVVPFAVFREAMIQQYGAMTPALIAKIKRTCRFLADGTVDCPGLASK